ncbi:MAG TPA: methyltransferase domain-containing protein [Nitrospira sp.]|nr:methyltransferase domain-containing protein [Nitrospira sp.]HNG01983.1 methyltransferase domain-containing protein [Nitrospira sp.]HNI18229.1 methyltransferase domain-containing protein [Nitrospira sp.]
MAKGQVLRAVELPATAVEPVPSEPLRLDVGCGKTKMDGWEGIDSIDFGQKHVHDVRKGLPFADNSVSEVRSSHFVEHLTGQERIAFFNELWRVMKDGATAQIVTPNWSHACAYGDPTHQWPPMSQWYPLYLHKEWRANNAPHVGYTCHFDHVVAGSWDQSIEGRNPETKSMMMNNYTNAWRDLIVTLTARK